MNMKRRDFSRATAAAALAPATLLAMDAHAQTGKFVAGKDYRVVEQRAAVEASAGKVEVVEFFWYSCPHCNVFEPQLEAWLKQLPKDIAFRRVHVAFNDSFVPQQKLFITLDAMGLTEKVHGKVFNAIHNEKRKLAKADEIADWVATLGVDRAKFLEQFNSFSTASKATRFTQLQNAYRIEGVPSFGIDGRFWTDGQMTGTMGRAIKVVEGLVAEIKAGR